MESSNDSCTPPLGAKPDRERLLTLLLASDRKRQQATRTVTPRDDQHEPPPLSFAQERLWFFEQLGLHGAAYNVPLALRLSGDLDVTALAHSFTELLRRHEVLRTHFEAQAGVPQQVVDAIGSFEFEREDLSHLVSAELSQRLRERIHREGTCRFNLSTGPLLRGVLLKLAGSEHVLLLTMHHIVCDGWSIGILKHELSTLYAAHSRGESSPLPPLAVQYADYALWQRRWLAEGQLQNQLHYWRESLSGAPPELRLPTDRPRPPVESFAGATLEFDIPNGLARELTELARREGATLFMVVLAAYAVQLSRWSGEQDIVVGTPIAGRQNGELEGVIGFFVNTLALRVHIGEELAFRELVRQVRQTTLAAYANQDVPFEALVRELRPERDASRQPIFQVSLSHQNYPDERFAMPGLECSWIQTDRKTAHFDLTLALNEHAGGIAGAFEYKTDLFERATIQRLITRFSALLEDVVAHPDQALKELPLTCEQEDRLLRAWNDTDVPYPANRLIHELFEEQVERAPNAIAVVHEGESLTYGELNVRANRLAHYLRQRGAQVGEYFPILMPRGLSMLVAQLAVLKVGAVYVPLDPDLPFERHAFMIRDCGARSVLADGGPSSAVRDLHVQWIVPAALVDVIGGLSPENSQVQVQAPAPAYVMYTSGSTGTPKGVIVTHRGVNRLVINNRYAQLGPADCIIHCSNPVFDASTMEIWSALLNGARLVIVPQQVVLDPVRFADLVIESGATVLFLTTGLFSQYVELMRPALARLRYLMTGGDVLDPGVVRRVLSSDPPQHLLNAYGPTECTTFATTHLIRPADANAINIPIGRPISNTHVHILDARLRPVPIGATGEICIGGPGVALGYLNRPELTAERFIRDPFSADPSARLYRTGDMGRWRADGTIDFLGRNDQQVKIRGLRIELGEIEAQLSRHPRIAEAVMLAEADGPVEKSLVAYLTCRDRPMPTPEQLRAHLKTVLPEYMIPSAFVLLERLPLTATGKVDRRTLPTLGLRAYVTREYEAPLGETEQALAEIWEDLLRVERIGRSDNFFELGGHSLHGVRMITKVGERFGVRLSGIAIFQYPTIQQMAQLVDATRAAMERRAAADELFEEGAL